MNRRRLDETGRSMSQTRPKHAARDDKGSSVVVRRLRKRRGECLTCGTKTHRLAQVSDPEIGGSFEQRVPLTIEGIVVAGRCIKCNPLPEDGPLPAGQAVKQQPWHRRESEIQRQQKLKKEKRRQRAEQQRHHDDDKAGIMPKSPRDATAKPSLLEAKLSSKTERLGVSKSLPKTVSTSRMRGVRTSAARSSVKPAKRASKVEAGEDRSGLRRGQSSRSGLRRGQSSRRHQLQQERDSSRKEYKNDEEMQQRQSSRKQHENVEEKATPSASRDEQQNKAHKRSEHTEPTEHNDHEQEVPVEKDVPQQQQPQEQLNLNSRVSSDSDLSTLGQESVMSTGVTLKRIRERQGLCSECGNRTHTFVKDDFGVQTKQPCTIEGLVRRGRCLKCYPLPNPLPTSNPHPVTNSTTLPDMSGSKSAPRGRSEPMAPPAPSDPTDKPKSILRRTSSYTVSIGSSKSGKSGKSVTIIHDDSSIESGDLRSSYDDEEDNQSSPTDAQLSSRSVGNKSSSKSTQSLFEPGADKSSSSSSPSMTSTDYKRSSKAARKEVEAALDRLNAINAGGIGGGADLVDIVATMRQHTNIEEVQVLGASQLYTRSKVDGVVIGRSGAIPTILDIMKNHAKSAQLHLICCKIIRNVADAGEYNRKVLAKHGAFNLICDTMAHHQHDLAIQSRGCAALTAMAEESKRSDSKGFDKARVLRALVEAVSAFPENEQVLRQVYKSLKAYGYKPMNVLMQWQDEKERRKLMAPSE